MSKYEMLMIFVFGKAFVVLGFVLRSIYTSISMLAELRGQCCTPYSDRILIGLLKSHVDSVI